jgi:SH3-like domain-containing protein
MFLRCVALACLLASIVSTVRAESFPYTAYIRSDDVNVRSGPGDNYYPVSKLARGDVVEVYRHDPGGWYAIRPPAGSFSWISGEFLKPIDGSTAVVIGDRVVARVGSAFSDVRDCIQVRLERGEEVDVIEAKRFNEGPAAQTWYKIAPPAGEFRWVSGKFVERELHAAKPRDSGPQNNLILARLAEQEAEIDAELKSEGRRPPDDDTVRIPAPGERKRWYESSRDGDGDDGDSLVREDRHHGSPHTRHAERINLPAVLDELDLEL